MNNKSSFSNNRSEIIYEDGLPFPFVKYDYGSWILSFGNDDVSFFICNCFKISINNYFKQIVKEHEEYYGLGSFEQNKKELKKKDGNCFGDLYSKFLRDYLKGFKYKNKICHRCNNKTPTSEYCHPMYGGSFKRTFGWYIDRKYYENKLDLNIENNYLDLLNKQKFLINKRYELIQNNNNSTNIHENIFLEINQIDKDLDKLERKSNNIIENIVREEFGFKPIGEIWVNETLIFKLVKEILPKSEVIQHYRGSELEGLEIDVFIKDKKIGFEYNGIQHYKPIKHFGGKKSLENVKLRDKKKLDICKKLGIHLHVIKYDEKISKELIEFKLFKIL